MTPDCCSQSPLCYVLRRTEGSIGLQVLLQRQRFLLLASSSLRVTHLGSHKTGRYESSGLLADLRLPFRVAKRAAARGS